MKCIFVSTRKCTRYTCMTNIWQKFFQVSNYKQTGQIP